MYYAEGIAAAGRNAYHRLSMTDQIDRFGRR